LKRKELIIISTVGVLVLALSLFVGQAQAQEASPSEQLSNEECLSCHSTTGMQTALPSGEVLYLSIDPATFESSIHGAQGLSCTNCHTNITDYPHPPLEAQDRRDVTLLMQEGCRTCHQANADAATNDAHVQALTRSENPNKNAAVCSDCHGAHDITDPSTPRSKVPQTCQKCHSEVYELYKTSVHGAALLGEGNPDVPECVSCHGTPGENKGPHNIQGPSNTAFHLFSPQLCAKCHANQELMDKYGINTDVFQTYLADFHGTTVEVFQAVAPGQETNKPVCIDCHGVHDIKSADDPQSAVQSDRLLATCQKCHPGATPNFPASWLSHYRPSPEHFPVVYYVTLFYQIFIPGVLGGMAFFVATDIFRRVTTRRRKEH
jgi:predicted CXXCH cytochrome family protein